MSHLFTGHGALAHYGRVLKYSLSRAVQIDVHFTFLLEPETARRLMTSSMTSRDFDIGPKHTLL